MYLFLHVRAVGWLVGYDEELQISLEVCLLISGLLYGPERAEPPALAL